MIANVEAILLMNMGLNDTLITIVLCTYNRAGYLNEALRAICRQTVLNFKLLILDNCSTDSTQEIVKQYLDDNRIMYIRHDSNIGGIANGNFGLDFALNNFDSKYIMITHDDDIMDSRMLGKEIDFLEKHDEVLMVSCGLRIIDQFGKNIKDDAQGKGEKVIYYGRNEYWKPLIRGVNKVTTPACVIRESVIREKGIRLRENAAQMSDCCCWAEINSYGPIAVLPDVLYNYRVHANQDSQKDSISQIYNMTPVLQRLLNKQEKYLEAAIIQPVVLLTIIKIAYYKYYNDSINKDDLQKVFDRLKLLLDNAGKVKFELVTPFLKLFKDAKPLYRSIRSAFGQKNL